jgi:hypothetical protein
MNRRQLPLFDEEPKPRRPVLPIGSVVFVRGVEARTRSAPMVLGHRPGSPVALAHGLPLRWCVQLEAREGLFAIDELEIPRKDRAK